MSAKTRWIVIWTMSRNNSPAWWWCNHTHLSWSAAEKCARMWRKLDPLAVIVESVSRS